MLHIPDNPKSHQFPLHILQDIWDKYQLGPIKELRYSASGKVNPLLFINEEHVLKVNIRDPELPKLQREGLCFMLLQDTQVPVPKLIATDTSKDILPYDFLVMGKMEGQELLPHINHLPPKQRKAICEDAGRLLGEIHRFRFDLFGDFSNGKGQDKTWWTNIHKKYQGAINACWDLRLCEANILFEARKLFERHRGIFDRVKIPTLVHNDFHLGNLLYKGNKITAVLDFEWALAGDAESEFKDPFTHNMAWKTMIDAYQEIRKPSVDFPLKNRLYKLLQNLQLLVVAHKHWGAEQQKYFHDQIVAGVNYFQ